MAREAALDPHEREKIGLPYDVLHRLDVLMDVVKNRILERSYAKATIRNPGAQRWTVNDEDVWLSACQVLRDTLPMLEAQLTKNAEQALRVRDAS